ERLRPRGLLLGQKGSAELFRQVHQDRARFEDAHRLVSATVEQRRNLGIGINLDETRTELLALADGDQPCVVFGTAVAGRQKLLEHDGDLLAVRRAKRVKLERMLADWQFLLMGRSGNRPVDI